MHEADFENYGQQGPYKTALEIPAVWLHLGGKYSEVSASRTLYPWYKDLGLPPVIKWTSKIIEPQLVK